MGTYRVLQYTARVSLLPQLNDLRIIGLVKIPGMMTGNLLAGTNPLLAAKYQMMIMFAITIISCAALFFQLFLTIFALFDKKNRILQLKIVRRSGKYNKDFVGKFFAWIFSFIRGPCEYISQAILRCINAIGRCICPCCPCFKRSRVNLIESVDISVDGFRNSYKASYQSGDQRSSSIRER